MKGYINLRDIPNCKLKSISSWHEQEYMSAPFKRIKGNNIGDKVRYSRMILIFDNGQKFNVKVAEIQPQNGYYEYPILIKKSDFICEAA